MRITIRYIRSRGLGQEIHETTFSGNVVSIGRGADQVIQIPDRRLPLAHSKISRTSGALSISAQRNQRCTVNEQLTRHAPLVVGDLISISDYTLRIVEGKNGADYAIDVYLDHEQSESPRERFVTRLSQLGVPRRQVAWLLFILLVGGGLLIPAAGFYAGTNALRDSSLIDDRFWSSGELDPTHAFMAGDCNNCHVQPFVQTRDKECLVCHRATNRHFEPDAMGIADQLADTCSDCHTEHSATGGITRTDAEVCVGCHADLHAAGFPAQPLRDVTDFSDQHPPFKLAMQSYGDDGKWHASRVDMYDPPVQEASNLLFSHRAHLAEAGIKSPQGSVVLACSDCHESEKGGLKMQPVAMERHCANCHALNFDAATPERVVPHGSPGELMRMLREYYAFQFLDRFQSGTVRASQEQLHLPETRPARRPGQAARPRSIADLMLTRSADGEHPVGEQARRYIEARVSEAADNLFEKQICIQCHEITRTQDDAIPWQVLPVRLNDNWMPLANFSHAGHKNMQCKGCHAARGSKLAADVLMPGIGVCRDCHGGEHTEDRLPGSCITCHSFHPESRGSWLDPATGVTASRQHGQGGAAP